MWLWWWYAVSTLVVTTSRTTTCAFLIPSRQLQMTMKTPTFHFTTNAKKAKRQSAFLGMNLDDDFVSGATFRTLPQQLQMVDEELTAIDADDVRYTTSTTERSVDVSSAIASTAATASTALVILATTTSFPSSALAASSSFSMGDMDPQSFQPVCPASDVFYRFLQGTTQAVVGEKSFLEYGPLIAGGLLRIRLELCVVESFFKEAVGPFIEQNGYAWILPIHETVETFLAGTIFALAATFILVGSTKILTVISTYADFFVGFPMRVLGGFAFDRARGKPVTLDVGIGPFKTRVVGPPEKKDEQGNALSAAAAGDADNNLLVEKLDNPLVLIVIAVSGALKVLGQGLGVSLNNVCTSADHVFSCLLLL